MQRSSSYKICPLLTYILTYLIVNIGEFAYIFRGGGECFDWGSAMGTIFHGGVPRGELFRGEFTLGEFRMRNSFYLSYFLFANSVLRIEVLRIIFRSNFPLGLN